VTVESKLPITRQCELMDLGRSAIYYQPVATSEIELDQMKELDQLHLKFPFMGSRQLRDQLRTRGYLRVNRKRIQRLMRKMGIEAIYPKPRTTTFNREHKIHPYLLRGLTIDQSNQVWCTDITYIPMAKGFVYLVAVMDWCSRKVLSWRLSNTMDVGFCVEALEEAIRRYGCPEIFNTDQGSQFTSEEFTNVLKKNKISISMDGKGRWMDNVFIERLWRSLKYEEVYLKAYDSIPEAADNIGTYLTFYNEQRTHQSLNNQTPNFAYELGLKLVA